MTSVQTSRVYGVPSQLYCKKDTLIATIITLQTGYKLSEKNSRFFHLDRFLNLLATSKSRHMVVLCGPKTGKPHHEYIDRKKENVIFTYVIW